MRLPPLPVVLPWLIGGSLIASLCCLALGVYLGFAAQADATDRETAWMAAQDDVLAREIDSGLAEYDLALREAARLSTLNDGDAGDRNPSPLAPLLTAKYISFIDVLNESGDVVADPRSNVSRPAHYAGRDYFQYHLKNTADVMLIGRPFGLAPTQRAAIPISRRLNRPDGSFAGVVVAGVQLTWLSDLTSHPMPGPPPTITIRRDDGLVLTRAPYDRDAIGHNGAADADWLEYSGHDGVVGDDTAVRVFRRLETARLVLEYSIDRAAIGADTRSWLLWLPLLSLIPGACAGGLSRAAYSLWTSGDRVRADANTANNHCIHLLSNMSHALRTPLSGLLGQADLMAEDGGLNDSQSNRLKLMRDAGEQMRQVVNRAIDFAHPGDFLGTPKPSACELDRLVQTCLGFVERPLRQKGLTLTCEIDPTTPRLIIVAHSELQEVLTNLLENAVKYTDHGTVALRIRGEPARLWIEVADTGRGVPDGKRDRLFRAYDRLDIPDALVPGSGVGLSIARHLVNVMHGQMGHRDNPGGGSVFWVELPITEAAGVAIDLPPEPPEARRLRILLADDSDITRPLTTEYLRSAGHTVTEVEDGEAALAQLDRGDFDLVLTDKRMPVVDGLEVTRRIRALPGYRGRTPVVLVTADPLAVKLGESGMVGVDVCVLKPFTRAELLVAVAAAGRLAAVPDPPAS